MSRLSRSQREGRAAVPSVSLPIGDRCAVGTKETLHKRVSLSGNPARESSPFGEAASSRPDPKRQRSGSEGRGRELVVAARSVFPIRQRLYSMDGHGRRSEIDTRQMGEASFQSLLEAILKPVRYDGPPPESVQDTSPEAPREVLEGYKVGPETGLPLPEWWELPEAGASNLELQAAIRRNLERATKTGKSPLVRYFPRGGGKERR